MLGIPTPTRAAPYLFPTRFRSSRREFETVVGPTVLAHVPGYRIDLTSREFSIQASIISYQVVRITLRVSNIFTLVWSLRKRVSELRQRIR